jgi:hypothetical protein
VPISSRRERIGSRRHLAQLQAARDAVRHSYSGMQVANTAISPAFAAFS